MKIEIKDLMVGDEIIVPSQSNLKYLKVLKAPTSKGVNYRGDTWYKTVLCSIYSDKTVLPVTKWRRVQGVQNNYKLEPDVSKHNARISLNLNFTQIWLVKRDLI